RGPAPERFGLARRTGRWSGFLHRTPSLRFRGVQSPRGSLHRDEFFNLHLFRTLPEAREHADDWLEDYNRVRPHSSLSNLTPEEFAATATTMPPPQESVA
ncbi:transposase, partial [bacterium]